MAQRFFPMANPLGLHHFMRHVQENSLKLSLVALCFWRLAKWGSNDARELLNRIGMQNRYLSWQKERLWNLAQNKPGMSSGIVFAQMQKL